MANDGNPFGDEQAKAAAEVAKATGKAIDLAKDLGPFLGRVFGQPIENAVGLLGADLLREVRVRNAHRIAMKTEEILKKQGVEDPAPVSPSLAIPLLQTAQDESREELQDLWAHLLANAMNPERSGSIRRSYIETVQQFDPLDAAVLHAIAQNSYEVGAHLGIEAGNITFDSFCKSVNTTHNELTVSFEKLEQLKCVARGGLIWRPTTYGQLMVAALA